MRALLDRDSRRDSDFEASVHSRQLKLGAVNEAQFVTQRLGDDKPSCRAEDHAHGDSMPRVWRATSAAEVVAAASVPGR